MPLASHRTRYLLIAFLLTWLGLMLFTRPAHGGWSADPVEVHATTALCPLVSVCTDGTGGSIVIWQETTASGGLLKARRLLASGDLDPAWPAAAAVSTRDVARIALGSVSDDAGGAYIWWTEGTQLLLTRVTAQGEVASGWGAEGRSLGMLATDRHRPIAVADGAGGVYVGWMTADVFVQPIRSFARAVHLGPGAAGAGGWPTGGRVLGTAVGVNPTVFAFGMDRASDGGLWFAWQWTELGETEPTWAGELRTVRLTPAGVPSPGWTAPGVSLEAIDLSYVNVLPGWSWYPPNSQVAVANDGGLGAFVLSGHGVVVENESAWMHNYLRHVDDTGAAFAGSEVVDIGGYTYGGPTPPEARASLLAIADGRGGLYTGAPWYATEFTEMVEFEQRTALGEATGTEALADQRGLEHAIRSDGGLFTATFKPSGATGPFEADAYIAVGQSPSGTGFFESLGSGAAIRYGDVGVASTADGGAIFAWSQSIDRQGVYAIRLNPGGQVTGVPPLTFAPDFRAWFVRGAGVRVTGGVLTSGLRVHDVTGREVARGSSDVAGEWTVPGTAELPSGIYFVKTAIGGKETHARVAVVR